MRRAGHRAKTLDGTKFTLNTKNLFFYSYDATKNSYTRITTPDYWVDTNGYSHMTVPFGGSVIITDAPLTAK